MPDPARQTDPSQQPSPGPWHVRKGFPSEIVGEDLGGKRGREIIGQSIRPANAPLIAAAPELYEALRACRATVAEMVRDGRAHFNCDLDALERADAALSKAEGRDDG